MIIDPRGIDDHEFFVSSRQFAIERTVCGGPGHEARRLGRAGIRLHSSRPAHSISERRAPKDPTGSAGKPERASRPVACPSGDDRPTGDRRERSFQKCVWPTWWFQRGGRTRSHSELGRETPQRP